MQYKARSGYKVLIDNDLVTLKKLGKEITFNKSSISEVELSKSAYDFPLIERSVAIRLDNKKKYVVKRLPKAQAEKLHKELLQVI